MIKKFAQKQLKKFANTKAGKKIEKSPTARKVATAISSKHGKAAVWAGSAAAGGAVGIKLKNRKKNKKNKRKM